MENKNLTLGSLFDGSGGFPLGGLLSCITPVWASEIEPFPIRVTTKRIPFMKHYGNVCNLKGSELEPVDIITFGSPCQDVSCASNNRKGLNGSRSSLFFEAIRIIKEMRCKTDGKYPRYAVFENVLGLFSSNKGADFKAVLEAICSVEGNKNDVSRPKKWKHAGEILADNYSIAWRVFDASLWGVPQRRRRIYLVADFRGQSAGKILFESEGLSRYSAQSFRAWQSATNAIGTSVDTTSRICLNDQGGQIMSVTENMTATLRASAGTPPIVLESHLQDSRYKGPAMVSQPVLSTASKPYNICLKERKNPSSGIYKAEISRTLDTKCNAPSCNQGGMVVVMPQEPVSSNRYRTVRKLMPSECARLQGFPAWWCSELGMENPTEADIEFWADVFEEYRKIIGKSNNPKSRKQIIKWLQNPHSDSAEYKMWGNGVVLPNVYFVLAGIVYYSRIM